MQPRVPANNVLQLLPGYAVSMATLGLQLAPDAAQAYEDFPVKPQREGQVTTCGCARCKGMVDTIFGCHVSS